MRFPDYPGHFPGDPIVPGAALLVAVEAAAGRPIARLERVRFLGVVRPGEDVEIDVAVEGERLRFKMTRDGTEVVRGAAVLGVAASSPLLRTAPTLARPIWGGTALAREWGKDPDPSAKIGETWEVWRDNRTTDGRRLGDVLDFPLLVKILDVRETLSVQVHPDDATAQRILGAPFGKHEAWVVLHAEPGARIAYGLNRAMDRDELDARAISGEIEADLAWLDVSAGDVIDVPPGTIHAIGGGILLYEVQQPCDLTWRFYDWGRGRPLHLEAALEVAIREPVVSRACVRPVADGVDELLHSPYFHVERVRVPTCSARVTTVWEAWTVVQGAVIVDGESVAFGATVLVPAGAHVLGGDGVVLAARV
jgi:mannose-6-phosphate isomerase